VIDEGGSACGCVNGPTESIASGLNGPKTVPGTFFHEAS